MSFETDKKNAPDKIILYDKSKKGSVDREISKLVKEINRKKDYYTTSSCAGRILLIKHARSGRKDEAEWLLASHAKVSFPALKKALEKAALFDEETWFKQEPLILHVACRDIDSAERLIHIVRSKCGLRRAGVMSLKRNIIEIIGSDMMYTIAAKDRKVLVDDSCLKILLEKANEKMDRNKRRIAKFYKEIKKLK